MRQQQSIFRKCKLPRYEQVAAARHARVDSSGDVPERFIGLFAVKHAGAVERRRVVPARAAGRAEDSQSETGNTAYGN